MTRQARSRLTTLQWSLGPILFNHFLEHTPDQLETLQKVSRILADDGVCLVRIPVKTESVWKMYGVDWVQIDAPRHLFIHNGGELPLSE